MLVVVTGATGFLGNHLVDALLAAGLRVRALARASSDTASLEARGVDVVRGGFDDASALAGADAIVHAAGGGKVESQADFYRANADSTRALLEAAPPLRHFVLVSSLSARAGVSHYGMSKAAAEAMVLDAQSRFDVTIVRPPPVYGPGDTRMLPLFKWARRGVMPVLGDGRTSIVWGPDCAAAIVLALTRDHPSGRIYYTEEGTAYSQRELGQHIAAAVGRRARRVRVPVGVVTGVAVAAEAAGKLLRRPVVLTRDKVADLTWHDWQCSADDLRADLGWAPTVAFPDGAARTARWYEQAGWL